MSHPPYQRPDDERRSRHSAWLGVAAAAFTIFFGLFTLFQLPMDTRVQQGFLGVGLLALVGTTVILWWMRPGHPRKVHASVAFMAVAVVCFAGLAAATDDHDRFAAKGTVGGSPTSARNQPTEPSQTAQNQEAGSSQAPGSDDATNSSSVPADPGAYFSGDLDWGEYNLDQAEPKTVGNRNIYWSSKTLYVGSDSEAELAIWTTDSVPSKKECQDTLASEGGDFAGPLVTGNRVCGETDEGRVFRIEVVGVSDSNGEMKSKTVVWNK